MSRIQSCFEALRRNRRKALIPFLTAGDPTPQSTVPLMHALVEAGADLLELGVPFSDPMADGPVIQRASERALKHGVSLRDVIGMVAGFRKNDIRTPVVLMGYLNPIEVMGYEAFVDEAARAGVDGVLTVDLPPEEAAPLAALLRKYDLDPVFLLSPTTSEERAARICQASSGFVYYVSLKGVTGAGGLKVDDVAARIGAIRKHTQLPIGVGFGIKDPATAARLSKVADAVVVASALLSAMEPAHADPEKLRGVVRGFVSGLRAAMDAA